MVACKRKCFKIKSSLMLIPNSISKNAKMKLESFTLSSLTQYISMFLMNTFWWRQMWQLGEVQNISLLLLCNNWWNLALFVTHFFNLTRSTYDYSFSLWFFLFCLLFEMLTYTTFYMFIWRLLKVVGNIYWSWKW
jgi:hypothetical protein